LPELSGRSRCFDIWCAASSTGQEPYSLAMLLDEHFPHVNANITATDLSTDVLDRARAARYTQMEVNRGLPAPLLVRYFRKDGAQWVLDERIRRRVQFRPLNLAEPFTLPMMDLVLLRNVLIYFDTPTKQDVLRRVCRSLRPGGYLLLGSAETALALDVPLERVTVGKAVVYRRA
jgi:chemotaxis protein methyltransferase CheR